MHKLYTCPSCITFTRNDILIEYTTYSGSATSNILVFNRVILYTCTLATILNNLRKEIY